MYFRMEEDFKCSSMKTKLQMFEDIGRLTQLNII